MKTFFKHYRSYSGLPIGIFAGPEFADTKGGATVAVQDMGDGKAVVAIARCSFNDVFCKKTGRELAAQRINDFLSSGSTNHVIVVDTADVPEGSLNERNYVAFVDQAVQTEMEKLHFN